MSPWDYNFIVILRDASGHAAELCALASSAALLHPDGAQRMTVGGLVEYVARERKDGWRVSRDV